jgi:cobalt-zinc-cadmium efflux system outer membrane protein
MKKLALLSALLLLNACAAFTPQLGFQEVNESVSSRTGKYLYWKTGNDADKTVDDALNLLLKEPLTPDSATQIALLNNNNLQATYQHLGIAQADLVEAGLLPNFIFNGEIRFPKDGVNLELSLVQNFIEIFQIPLRKKMAESLFEEAKIEVVSKALSLSYNVRKAFYEYQGTEQLLEMSNTALLALEASRDLARKLHMAGNITDLDLAQEEVNYETLKIETSNLEEHVVQTKENVNALLGLSGQSLSWKIDTRLSAPSAFNSDSTAVEEHAIANNLALAKIKQRFVTLTAKLSQAERFRLFGDSEIGASAAKEAGEGWGFGPAFSFPLQFFNQGQVAVFRVNAELARQHGLGLDLTNRIQSHVRSTLKQLKITEGRLTTYRKTLLPLHTKLVSESQRQYNAMLLGAFQLLEAKHKQIMAGKDYIESLKNYWLLRTELESILNGNIPSDLSVDTSEE